MTNRILIVGEAYGREEEKVNKPFVGRSGKLLNKALEECGLSREEVTVTNVCLYRPTDAKGRTRKPNLEEITKGCSFIRPSFSQYDKIILLGDTAHKCLSPVHNRPISRISGLKLIAQGYFGVPGYMISSIYHPAYILRNPSKYAKWVEQLRNCLT